MGSIRSMYIIQSLNKNIQRDRMSDFTRGDERARARDMRDSPKLSWIWATIFLKGDKKPHSFAEVAKSAALGCFEKKNPCLVLSIEVILALHKKTLHKILWDFAY